MMKSPNRRRWNGNLKQGFRPAAMSLFMAALLSLTLIFAGSPAIGAEAKVDAKAAKTVAKATADKKADKKPDTKPATKKEALPKPPKTEPKAAWKKSAPESIDDLIAIQKRVQGLLKKLIPATVGVQVGGARGSGVIISADGYVLTAGHVSGTPNRPVTIILADGKRVSGKSLGRNSGIDSGLFKIDSDRKDWPHVDMGRSNSVSMGDWAIAIGHPGGWQKGRPPVVRLGRVIGASDRVIWTDATLVGGDSGGPLFDFDGKVVGIHSRISGPTSANFHVPVDTYHDTWDRLVASEDFTDRPLTVGAVAGFNAENHKKGARLTTVTPRAPADLAGLKVGDVITKFGSKKLRNVNDLVAELHKRSPSDDVKVEYMRNEKLATASITLAAGYRASPFLGITGRNDDGSVVGAAVNNVFDGTPAAKAKIQVDDVITSFNGKTVRTLNQLQDNIRRLKAGDSVDLDVKRGKEVVKLKVTLGMRG